MWLNYRTLELYHVQKNSEELVEEQSSENRYFVLIPTSCTKYQWRSF